MINDADDDRSLTTHVNEIGQDTKYGRGEEEKRINCVSHSLFAIIYLALQKSAFVLHKHGECSSVYDRDDWQLSVGGSSS